MNTEYLVESPRTRLSLIVGAGASNELGLPLGSDLKSSICSLLEYDTNKIPSDRNIHDAIDLETRHKNLDFNNFINACKRITEGLPLAISIDHFVDAHRGDQFIELSAKLAIARAILAAEKGSAIHLGQNTQSKIKFGSTDNTWLNQFWRVLTENIHLSEIESRLHEISLIIFNYDRCVEHYLFNAFQAYYGIGLKESADLVNKIEIFHPYGTVGELPWQSPNTNVAFGEELYGDKLLQAATNIKTFTESINPNISKITRIHEILISSERILILGFAYHKLNLDLLKPEKDNRGTNFNCSIFATAHGVSEYNLGWYRTDLVNYFHFNPTSIFMSRNLKCRELFSEYAHGISLS